MADVTSTARLIVTVEGENKIKALAAQIKALQGLSGSKRIGGVTGPAQMVAQNAAMKRAATQMMASQAITGRMLKPLQAQVQQTSKIVAPLVAQQAQLAKAQKATAADMLRAEKARAKAIARGRENYPAQAAAASGITDKLLRSIQKRNMGMSLEDARRAATGGTRQLPGLNKRDIATAVGQGWMTRAAGAAQLAAMAAKPAVAEAAAKAARSTPSARVASGGRSGRAGSLLAGAGTRAVGAIEGATGAWGVGALARGLGSAALAAVPLAAAAGSMAIGFKAANAQAEDLVTNTAKSLKSRREVDEVEARQAAGEAVFGPGYAGLEKRLPKMLSDQRAKRGIAGEKGLYGRLGLDPAHVKKMEAAGKKLDAYDIGQIFAKKREQLEAAVEGAKTPKAADAAKKRLAQFWKDVGLFGPELVRATAFGSEALAQFLQTQQQIQQAYGAGLVDEKQQLRDAQQNILLRSSIGSQFKEGMDRIGTQALPGVNQALAAFNQKMLELGPSVTTTIGQFARLGWEGIASSINSIDSSKLKTALDDLNKSLTGASWETLDTGLIASKLGTAMKAAWDAVDWSSSISAATAKLPSLVGTALKAAFEAGMTGLGDAIGEGVQNMINVWRKRLGLDEQGEPEGATPEERAAIEKKAAEERAAREAGITPEEYKRRMEAATPPVKRVDIQSDQTTVTQPTPAVTPAVPPTPGVTPAAPAAKPAPGAVPTTQAPSIVPDQTAFTNAGTAGGNAFSQAAASGITKAGSDGGAAFSKGINAAAIGGAIGTAAAAKISAAKVTVNVVGAGGSSGGNKTGTAPAGTDSTGD